jgi:hypothetical protein
MMSLIAAGPVSLVVRRPEAEVGMGSFDFEHSNAMQHYACFACRKAFKVRGTYNSTTAPAPCPECKGPMTAMGVLFRAPRQRAVKAWRRLEELARGSPQPLFQLPGIRPHERPPPGYHCGAEMVAGRCVYCGFSPRASSGGRPSQAAYRPGSQDAEPGAAADGGGM